MILRAQQIIDQVFEARIKKKAKAKPGAPLPPPSQAGPLMNPEELNNFALSALGFADFIEMLDLIERHSLDINGKVTRHSNHYVHERSTDFEWEVNPGYGYEIPAQDQIKIDDLANKIQDTIGEEIITINKKIYRALNREYDSQHEDETVEENIRASEYEFDADGEREDGGGFQFDALPNANAKERARDWFREGCCNDSYWYEHIYEEWQAELESMGFESPEINFSGFSSQGDGASFTCPYFDFRKYAQFFMSGRDKDVAEGHPYTDDLNESDLGIDMEQFSRDAIHADFSSLATLDPDHQGAFQQDKHYKTEKMSPDNKCLIRLSIFDDSLGENADTVTVTVTAQSWSAMPDVFRPTTSGKASRKVRFFVPMGSKPKLVAALLDYWSNAREAIDKRDRNGNIKDPQKMCGSLAYRLSLLAGLWKREYADARYAHNSASLDRWRAANPEQAAAYDARYQARQNRPLPQEPSEEKLALRAEMKKWKAERAAAAVPPPPAQESANDDLLAQMGGVATRASVGTIGNVMAEQPVRYMTGAKQYHWHKTTPDWRWKITSEATVYDPQLPKQPWEVSVRVYDNDAGGHYFIDKLVVTDNEKNIFGAGVRKMIPLLEDIADRSWDAVEPLLKALEIVFNQSLGKRETASPNHRIATFSKY